MAGKHKHFSSADSLLRSDQSKLQVLYVLVVKKVNKNITFSYFYDLLYRAWMHDSLSAVWNKGWSMNIMAIYMAFNSTIMCYIRL